MVEEGGSGSPFVLGSVQTDVGCNRIHLNIGNGPFERFIHIGKTTNVARIVSEELFCFVLVTVEHTVDPLVFSNERRRLSLAALQDEVDVDIKTNARTGIPKAKETMAT